MPQCNRNDSRFQLLYIFWENRYCIAQYWFMYGCITVLLIIIKDENMIVQAFIIFQIHEDIMKTANIFLKIIVYTKGNVLRYIVRCSCNNLLFYVIYPVGLGTISIFLKVFYKIMKAWTWCIVAHKSDVFYWLALLFYLLIG